MLSGFLILDKPLGLSSNDALIKAKRILQIGKKAGHAGTLDPLASGVLPIAFNEATKVLPLIVDTDKEYEFTVRWGIATTTDDMEGEVIYPPQGDSELPPLPRGRGYGEAGGEGAKPFRENTNPPHPAYRPPDWMLARIQPSREKGSLERTAIKNVLKQFIGTTMQTPPIYSALKVNGERAYNLARAGIEFTLAPRPIIITALELVDIIDENHASFRATCGKGTYIRALARDIAKSLGTVGHLTALRRTRVGQFHVKDAISLDKLAELGHMGAAEAIQPIATALDDIPALAVTSDSLQRLRQGQPVTVASPAPDATIVAFMDEGLALGIGVMKEGRLWPKRLFNL